MSEGLSHRVPSSDSIPLTQPSRNHEPAFSGASVRLLTLNTTTIHEAHELTHPPSTPLLTPINALLALLLIGLIYTRLRPSKTATSLPTPPAPTVFKTFTPPQLQPYNGTNNMPVYLAVRGRVFDVSPGRNFYGPGGPYANFAGRDASRGLACGSFDEEMLTEDLNGPLDRLEDLGAEEMEAMRGWEERFSEKYLVVGKLVPVGHEEAEKDE